jgi:hypothetical protein
VKVDVVTSVHIARAPGDVAAFASDPATAPEWYRNIESATWETEPPLTVGSRIRFVARFMGKTMRYTYEVRELGPSVLRMATTEGFVMETTYTWEAEGDGTRMTLRNRGEPRGPALMAPVMEAAMRSANDRDLQDLKRRLEGTV